MMCLQAQTRVKLEFLDKLAQFWDLQVCSVHGVEEVEREGGREGGRERGWGEGAGEGEGESSGEGNGGERGRQRGCEEDSMKGRRVRSLPV